MIYNYLFYKSYQFGKPTADRDDSPVWTGIIWVGGCVMFNVFTVFIVLEALGIVDEPVFKRSYKLGFSLILVLVLLIYYSYKGRYKKIIEKYEAKERTSGRAYHPFLVVMLYILLSFGILMLAGMYKNGAGLFS